MRTYELKQWRSANGERVLSAGEVRRLLEIDSRDRWLRYKKTLGFNEKQYFLQSEIAEFVKLQQFISAKPGKHSYDDYIPYRKRPMLLGIRFKQWGIDIEFQILRINQLIREQNHEHYARAVG